MRIDGVADCLHGESDSRFGRVDEVGESKSMDCITDSKTRQQKF